MPTFRAFVLSCAVLSGAAGCSDSTGPSGSPSAQTLAIGGGHICRIVSSVTSCWGDGTLGQLGIDVTPADTTPVILDAPAFTSIAAGETHTCALDAAGQAWCWGSNRDGELGTGTLVNDSCGGTPCQRHPVQVATTARFTALAAGSFFTCGLTESHALMCWGVNDAGQLATTADTNRCEAVRCSLTPLPTSAAHPFVQIVAGRKHACGLTTDGQAWCWGFEAISETGTHLTRARFSPEQVSQSGTLRFRAISAGGYHSCAIAEAGTAWCWGLDAMGAGTDTLESPDPVRVAGSTTFRQIQSGRLTSCALDQDGKTYCWGANSDGSVGVEPIGSAVRFDVPVAAGGSLRFQSLIGGSGNYCGTTSEGRTLCWGRGDENQLLNNHADAATPTPLP